ncbi:PC-esterase domain-containing protein 1B [Marmota marmota marmota]|uniref:PC-esterase domain-containing protein 1B n=2 Tax=Marmota TaxID=9992 RepID=A0A834QVY6_MARMO|nr:PC-esterase domain-containing protein 1B [Marmota marmota marmota]XP_048658546.1 PC-esterase domain-containing protein 1B [Marmota marmota marmota]XP_048658548.1 PC-esterase domain-containing protein 1B [Marmota marmota marmota]XP_048658549.1 PC-esterase domain-containing protein 1B [Marmota marmota marmota]XP_048658550.1 PC-esterase domain-containing protein 1B [Marmota marmota marmota]XP_048658551.1 PC-esterase domain-containing protein 1B [Marmota marmota marmota]XP_048658552.1 PC-ester
MGRLLASEVQQLLHNKFVVILGDSVQRAVYKDLVLLLQKDCLLTPSQLKAKGELTFEQDKLVKGGQLGPLHNGTNYREVRQFSSDHHLVRFYFLTRVYSKYLEAILEELQSGEHAPDLIIMNSCLWDVSRYGPHSWNSYLQNLENLFGRLGEVLPESCLLVWNTAMPVGKKITARFLPRKPLPWAIPLRRIVVHANFYSSIKASKHGFDVLDLHFHFRHAWNCLQSDGVHWNEHAHRQLSYLLLTHVAEAWGVELPCRPPAPIGELIQDAPEWEHRGQAAERQPQANRDQLDLSLSPPLPSPRRRPLLETPRPRLRPLLPPPVPPHHMSPPSPHYPQDCYFSSDHVFQSDQFYFQSDVPSSTQPGFAFEADFNFCSPPPMASFSPCYQQRAPVVYRGFSRYLVQGPYMPWRGRHRRSKRGASAPPESRRQ